MATSDRARRQLAVAAVVASVITAVWLILVYAVGPQRGLSWSLRSGGFSGPALLEGRTNGVELESLPLSPDRLPTARSTAGNATVDYSVRWHGFWFAPREEDLTLQASADQRVRIYLDGVLVVESDQSNGPRPARASITLTPGSHQLVVDSEHRQDSANLRIGILPRGRVGEASPLPAHQLFDTRVDHRDYLLARAIPWVGWLALGSWLFVPMVTVVSACFRGWPREPGAAWRRARVVAFPAALGPIQILLFGTHEMYRGNANEFSAPFWQLAVPLLPVLAGITALLTVFGLFLDERRFRGYVAALFGVGVLVWLQGGILLADYGVLDGRDLEWGLHAWRAPWELGLWLAVPIACVARARHIFPIAPLASQLLIALNVVVMVASLWRPVSTASSFAERPSWAFELSRTRNVIHLVLDGFQSDVFHELLERNQTLQDTLSGFVFYAEHAGAFPTTIASIPAMLTGELYRNQEPLRPFIARSARDGSLLARLRPLGFDTDAIGIHRQGQDPATHAYAIPRPYVSYDDYIRFSAWQLVDLSAFRHTPHPVKEWLYNDQRWRLQVLLGQGSGGETSRRRFLPENGHAFLEDFVRLVEATRDRPVYKFVHVGIPHLPVVLNSECEFVGVIRPSRDNYAGQAQCAVRLVTRLLDRLRVLGIYDSSVIVISSDHGLAMRPRDFVADDPPPLDNFAAIAGSARALLAVKPARASGRLRISTAATSIVDIPATVLDALGEPLDDIPGTSVLPGDSTPAPDDTGEVGTRERWYAWYPWNNADWNRDFIRQLNLLAITGRMGDGAAWSYRGTVFEPTTDLEEMGEGWEAAGVGDTGTPIRRVTRHARAYAPPLSTSVRFQIRPVDPLAEALTAFITINGEERARLRLTDSQWRAVDYEWSGLPAAASARLDIRVDSTRSAGTASGAVLIGDLQWQ